MSKEVKEIKYKRAIIEIDGVKQYKYDFVSASLKCTKRYNNAVCLLMGISGCAHHLIEWLSDNMTEGGYVHNDKLTRRSFIDFHCKHGKGRSYSHEAVQKAFKQLANEQFIVQIGRGIYKINPLMYFADKGEEERFKSIKWIMEFINGVETKGTLETKK